LAAEQSRYEDAFRDLISCYRLGHNTKRGGTLVEQLVGIAVEALTVRTLRDVLAEFEIDSATLAALQRDLEKMAEGEDFAPDFKAEKLIAYDAIQRCFTGGRFGGGHLCLEGLKRFDALTTSDIIESFLEEKRWLAPIHILFTHPNRHETREMVDRLYDFWDEMSRKNPAQLRAENIDIEDQMMEIIRGNILLEILVPALGRIGELCHRIQTDVQATVAVLGLLRYKKDKGFYPENLKELMDAGYLKQLPTDLYSNKPLVYKRVGDGFTLYSLGADFDDDDGLRSKWGKGEPEGGDQLFWPVESPEEREERLKQERERNREFRRGVPRVGREK